VKRKDSNALRERVENFAVPVCEQQSHAENLSGRGSARGQKSFTLSSAPDPIFNSKLLTLVQLGSFFGFERTLEPPGCSHVQANAARAKRSAEGRLREYAVQAYRGGEPTGSRTPHPAPAGLESARAAQRGRARPGPARGLARQGSARGKRALSELSGGAGPGMACEFSAQRLTCAELQEG
jgi:hypothetical protein